MITTDDIISAIIQREGDQYTDRGADRGGPTKFGITLATLQGYRKMPVTAADVAALSESDARAIYAEIFIRRPRFDKIADEELRAEVVDAAAQHAPERAAKMLQEAAGVPDDGVVGSATLTAVNAVSPRRLRLLILGRRMQLEGHLITRDHSQADFAEGWANRLVSLLADVAMEV